MSFTEIPSRITSTVTSLSNILPKFSADPAKLPPSTNGTTTPNGFPVVPGFQSGLTNSPPIIADGALQFNQAANDYLSGNPLGGFNAPNRENYSAFSTSVVNGQKTLGKKKEWDELTDSDKRLNVIRARSAQYLYTNNGGTVTYSSDRGPIARMRLLKGPDYDPALVVKGARSNVDKEVAELLSEGGYTKFFVTDINLNLNEKMQIMQTFGDNEVVYYFGKQPLIVTISGLLFDSIESDWFSKFLTLYTGVLRGTQLARSMSLVRIEMPNMVLIGSISGLGLQQNSQRDTDIGFSMQFVAKEIIPLPAPVTSENIGMMVGKLIDFKANRPGVQGYSLSSGTLGRGFMDPVLKSFGATSSVLDGVLGSANAVNTTLNAFRTNIFTPVFGVISSITKIVQDTTGTITKIVSSFTNPVNQILRDITNISTQASALALMVENSVNNVIAIPARTVTNVENTIRSVKSAAGTITRVPENISQTFRRLYGGGRVKKGAAILSSGKTRKKSKTAILGSGAPYTPIKSNTL